MTDLTQLTVKQCLSALEKNEISSRELTAAFLARIDSLEPSIHAFITLMPEKALASADAADKLRKEMRQSGAALPPLLGLPLAIKDVLCVAGIRATCGSKILEDYVQPFNATAVQRLLDAGMVPLGKTKSTESSAYGETHNPWDLERVPGGSSGGSAAAVTAQLVLGAVGTDTGGSVRQPASFCGLSGIKPTYGRVSRYGLAAYGSSLDTVGALAHNVEEVSLMFHQMAGHDPLDATSMDLPLPDLQLPQDGNLKGLRIGVPNEYFIEGMQPDVEKTVRIAVEQMRELGAVVTPVSLPHTGYALPVYYLIAPAEASANLARYDGIRFGPCEAADALWDQFELTRGRLFGPEVKRRIMLGTYALSAGYYDAYYGQAQKVRTLIKADFDLAFDQVDVILTPVAPSTALRFGEHTDDPLAMYLEDVFTLPANLAGVPALALPAGFDHNGMPVGMQLMGPHFREDLLFRTGHSYQLNTDWHLQRPALLQRN